MKAMLKQGLFLLLCSLAMVASAAPQVELNITVEKDITETNEKGEAVTRRVAAEDAIQGDELFYTITYKNTGDEAATNVQLDNPVAEGTTYKADSAWGDGADILFSIDGGKSFKKASNITYQVTGSDGKPELRKAEPETYNAIRWLVKEIKPGSEGKAGFNVKVD